MGLTNISQSPAAVVPATNIGTGSGDNTLSSGNIAIPVYASWFDPDQIHDIERRSLPEFFIPSVSSSSTTTSTTNTATPATNSIGGEKNASTYKEYRNFMINQYRGRPHEYLSVTMCRRHLIGDVGAILRVHSFLEQWGLINYHCEGPVSSSSSLPGPKRERPPYVPTVQELPAALAATMMTIRDGATHPIPKPSPRIISSLEVQSSPIECASCRDDCSKLYYVYNADNLDSSSSSSPSPSSSSSSMIIVCPRCYAEGKYSSALTASEFVRVDVSALENSLRASWTEEETLKLLEAVEANGQDWDAISAKVGRPREQCLLHFLRLPHIESLPSKSLLQLDGQIPAGAGLFFSAATTPGENPILNTLAFLAAQVHPKVAAAAAQAALQQVEQLAKSITEQTSINGQEDGQEIKEEKDDDEKAAIEELDISKIGATALACAAARAKDIAEGEARKAGKLRDTLIELQLQKVKAKLNFYENLEKSLEEDHKDLEQQRLQLFLDRYNVKRQMLSLEQRIAPESATNTTAATETKFEIAEKPSNPTTDGKADTTRPSSTDTKSPPPTEEPDVKKPKLSPL